MIYVTGDTHGCFSRIELFCEAHCTTKDDVLIILGDAGINYADPKEDRIDKIFLESLPIIIFAIHGNHERRPETIPTYKTKLWNDGTVYYEEEFPSLLFAKDGEIFNLDGKSVFTIGGAYSVDKELRLLNGWHWFSDEQPSEATKQYAEQQLVEHNWKVDIVLSHTAPLKYEPTEVFLPGIDQSRVDKTTEEWLDTLEDRLQYDKWYCGHYHTQKQIDRIEFMYGNVDCIN